MRFSTLGITIGKFLEYKDQGLPERWPEGICVVRDCEGDICCLAMEEDIRDILANDTGYMLEIIFSDGTFTDAFEYNW